jgi:catechol 2,3-dioxygenase
VQVRVLDLDESVNFYKDVMGLVETGRDDQGRVYFKCWDERDHNSYIIREAETAGLDFFAFKVLDGNSLDQLEQNLQAYGISTMRIPAGEMLATGERVRFELPSGHLVELYAEKEVVGNGLGENNPMPWDRQCEHGIAPVRLDHGLLYGPNIGEVKKIFTEVLGFFLVEQVLNPEGTDAAAIWLSCSHKVHDIAFAEFPEKGKLHHTAFMMESWEKVLRAGDIMSMNNVRVDMGPTRHGITRGCTIYAWDPSGNRFETFMGGYQPYPDYEPLTWTFDNFGQGLDFPQRKLHETFLTVVT